MQRLHERNHKKTKKDFFNVLKKKSSKKLILALFLASATAGFVTLYITGNVSAVVDIYPIIKIDEKTTILNCDYAGETISTSVKTHSNVSNYYKNLSSKNSYLENANFESFVYSNRNDSTIKNLASDIRSIAESRNLNDDQMLELATCFVQNIPYDEEKASTVLSNGLISNRYLAQFPYETLYENSGICTDKTYLGSALINELGYGTGILLFPDAQHMSLGISAPQGYGDFGTKYVYMEVTNPGFAPGEVPAEVNDANGRAAVSIDTLSDISISQNPSDFSYDYSASISQPNLVIDVNEGREYSRITTVRKLEEKIYAGLDNLELKADVLDRSYSELESRDYAQQSAYNSYLSTPDTKLDCGYKYDYSYDYYSYDYSYSSPYTYSCDDITNPQKNYSYNSYLSALGSYNNQVDYYNGLLDEYNTLSSEVELDIDNYKSYSYN